MHNYKPAILFRDHGRYLKLDVQRRVASLAQWNRPVWWPLGLIAIVVLGVSYPIYRLTRRFRGAASG